MSDVRNSVILSGKERIVRLLQVIKENPKLSFTELGAVIKQAKVKSLGSGSFWNTLKDARAMGLVENGYGFVITPLGEDFIAGFSPDAMKKAYLNVKLFNECYKQLPNETNYAKIREWFLAYLGRFDKRLRGTVIRRYLEGVYEVNVPKKPRVNLKVGVPLNEFSDNIYRATQTNGESQETEKYYFEILKAEGYTDAELSAIGESLSSVLSKDKAWRILHRKVKG